MGGGVRVSVAVIGRDHWDDLTEPFVRSCVHYEPGVPVFIFDAGSSPHYPWKSIRIGPMSYAAAMNRATRWVYDWDWLIICNNDVLCTGPFSEMLYQLEPGLYGGVRQRRQKDFYGHHIEYLTGDITGIHRSAWEQIGPWDERFLALGGCEDIDYSLRADKLGLLKDAVLPFRHLGLHHRKRRADYRATVDHNRMKLLEKIEAGEYD